MLGFLLAAATRLAVLELTNTVPAVDRAHVAQVVRAEASKTGSTVMTREQMVEIANANPDALSRCNEESCVEVGRLLGADQVVDGRIDRRNGRLHIALRLVDMKSGKRLRAADADAASDKALEAAAAKAARALFRK